MNTAYGTSDVIILISISIQSWNRTYVNSTRIGKYRIFNNILEHSRINWRVIAKTDFHIRYSPIFIYLANLEVPRMYSAPNNEYREYTNTVIPHITVRPFSSNVLGYSPRINVCAVPALDKYRKYRYNYWYFWDGFVDVFAVEREYIIFNFSQISLKIQSSFMTNLWTFPALLLGEIETCVQWVFL